MKINKQNHGLLPGMYDLKKIWNPSWFQGNRKKDNYFEGWYFKVADSQTDMSWAFIPGISLALSDSHSFVQIINGKTGQTWYFRYPLEAFSFSHKGFQVQVGNNRFSSKQVELDIDESEFRLKGHLQYQNNIPFKASLLRPGIMGWYRYVPFMECYHGVVSINSQVDGTLVYNDKTMNFVKARGYIEKDWGRSMPESWIWMQTNNFETPNTSFMLSIARIPWIGKSFTGFLGFLQTEGKRFDFTTYTGAKIVDIKTESTSIDIAIQSKQFRLAVESEKRTAGSLKAPQAGNMQRIIHESIDSNIHVTVTDRQNHILFQGIGRHGGLETVGDQKLLLQ